METTNQNVVGNRRKRKILLALPLLAIPLLTLMFRAAGGGSVPQSDAAANRGFNLKLPNAQLDGKAKLSKLNYYENAAIDSAKMEELRKKDPNYRASAGQDSLQKYGASAPASGLTIATPDPKAQKLMQKLDQLKQAVNAQPASIRREAAMKGPVPASGNTQDIERLEQMMLALHSQEPEDREMQQINGMLENILDIQYPERLKQKIKKASDAERGQVFTVQQEPPRQPVSVLLQDAQNSTAAFGVTSHNRFYSLEEAVDAPIQNAVQATIAETQAAVNGTTVKLRLGQDIYVNGTCIPASSFVYGVASLKGERLTIAISNVRHGNSLFPVDMSVYDLDGLEGLFIPGAISRDVAKASADQTVQGLGVTTLSDSWSAQAAGAGIEAAKTLFSKKVKLVKVTVKAGYQVLLKDNKKKDKL